MARLARIGRHPLGWLAVGVVGVGLVSAIVSAGPVFALLGAAAAVAVYWAVMRFVARRPAPEIARRGAGREALRGAALGAGFVIASVLVIASFGGYSLHWADDAGLGVLLSVVCVSIGAAVTEELLFRGLALQAIELLAGSRVALVVTAALFGLIHLANPDATLWSSVAIAIEAGVLLGAAFLWRRDIWFVVGLHCAWNATEGLLGIPVSGHTADGLFATETSGPAILTGGGFGLEASLVPVLISLALAVPMLVLARRRGVPVQR